MVVRLKYYGPPTAGVDRTDLQVEIPADSTVEGLLQAAWGKTSLLESASFLVNNSRATLQTALNENDEVVALRLLRGG